MTAKVLLQKITAIVIQANNNGIDFPYTMELAFYTLL